MHFRAASCANVISPLMAASATFALKAGVWFRRGRMVIVSPDSWGQRARCQADTPLIVLCRFPRPAVVAIDGALAEGDCGPGFHRNESGRCRPNGSVVVAPGAPVVVAPAAPVVVAPAPVVCGAGYRWQPRFRPCVVL